MRMPIINGSYDAYSEPLAGQRCINWYPEINTAGRSGVSLRPTAGTVELSSVSGACRGLQLFNGLVHGVFGTTLYSIGSNGTATSIGTVAGSGRCVMCNDGSNLTIVNGSEGYVYDGATFAQITDEDFYPADFCIFFDSYTVYNRSGTGQFFISTALGPSSIDGLDFASAEGAPDDTLAIINNNRLLYLFGEHTIEIWQNIGAADFPFARVAPGLIEKGCGAKHSVKKMDASIFWLADDGLVYRIAQDYSFQSITPPGIANMIKERPNRSNAYANAYIYNGHAFYDLHFDDMTLCYDVTTGLWHEKSTWVDYDHARWRYNHILEFNGSAVTAYDKHLMGGENGNLYYLDDSTYTDNGDQITRDIITTDIHGEGRRLKMPELEVLFEEGVGLPDGSDPQVMLKTSNDGGRTWSNEQWRSIGKIGEYLNRTRWTRQGQFRQRRFWFRVTDPIKAVIIDSWGSVG